jgi:hypothetical protein
MVKCFKEVDCVMKIAVSNKWAAHAFPFSTGDKSSKKHLQLCLDW